MGDERRHAKPSVARNFAVVQQSLESDAEKADLGEAETSLAAVVIAHSRLRPSRRLELLRFRRCSWRPCWGAETGACDSKRSHRTRT